MKTINMQTNDTRPTIAAKEPSGSHASVGGKGPATPSTMNALEIRRWKERAVEHILALLDLEPETDQLEDLHEFFQGLIKHQEGVYVKYLEALSRLENVGDHERATNTTRLAKRADRLQKKLKHANGLLWDANRKIDGLDAANEDYVKENHQLNRQMETYLFELAELRTKLENAEKENKSDLAHRQALMATVEKLRSTLKNRPPVVSCDHQRTLDEQAAQIAQLQAEVEELRAARDEPRPRDGVYPQPQIKAVFEVVPVAPSGDPNPAKRPDLGSLVDKAWYQDTPRDSTGLGLPPLSPDPLELPPPPAAELSDRAASFVAGGDDSQLWAHMHE